MAEWLQHLDLKDALKHDDEAMPGWLFWTYAGISAGLVTMAGLMSGLTLGLMSLDEIDLEVQASVDVTLVGCVAFRQLSSMHTHPQASYIIL